MFEPRTTLTYDEAFARARKERSAAFRELFGFGKPASPRASGWSLLRRASHA